MPRECTNIIHAIDCFGFGSLELKESDILDPKVIIQLDYPPYRRDFILSLSGADFQTCSSNRIIEEIEGVQVNFIDLESPRKNKEATGRKQDLADLENLE